MNKLSPEIIKELPKKLATYRIPSYKKAIIQIFNTFWPFLGLCIIAYVLKNQYPILSILLSIINGFFLLRIFIIQHDCGHQSFTKSRTMNTIVWWFSSLCSLIPYSFRAKTHNFHHTHSAKIREFRDIGDIDYLTVDEFKALSPFRKLMYKIFRHSLFLFWFVPLWYIFVQVHLPLWVGKMKWRIYSTIEMIINTIVSYSIYIILILIFWFKSFLIIHLPSLVVFSILAFWFFYVQHQYEYTYKAYEEKWNFVQAALLWSSYYKLPQWLNRFTGDIAYHHIHHLNLSIPNYELARCHKENPILDEIITTFTIRESLQLVHYKLWDNVANKMISFKEYYKSYTK
jgi:acyl-lipid omega-6 desaturase (Delta-12 desaturase)